MSKVVVIDAGHGGKDPGAEYNGRQEKNDTLRMALVVRDHLKNSGVTVVMTRTTDVFLELQGICDVEIAAHADLFCSIHRNASKPNQAYGVETYSLAATGNGRALASNIQNEIVAVGVNANRGLKTANYYVLKNTNSPAALVEVGFIDSDKDNATFDAKFDAYAKAIAKGILKTLGLEFKEAAPQPQPTPSNLFRVRKSWADTKSQIGAFGQLDNAKECVDKNPGYIVFDNNGAQVYPSIPVAEELYRVRKSWDDVKSQISANKELANAKKSADENPGYKVFNSKGEVVYTPSVNSTPVVEAPKPTPIVEQPKPTPPVVETPKPIPAPIVEGHAILGVADATAGQMAWYVLKNNPSPKLNCSILELANFYLTEGAAEGVRGDFAFAQAIKETGFFKFGGDVLPEQNNYCGLGTTGGGVKGAYFTSPQEGARAQIQHLKAYATIEPLRQDCVDPRYKLVTKGQSPTLEGLNGKWAVPGNNYGQEIYSIYEKIKAEIFNPIPVEPPVVEEKPPVVVEPTPTPVQTDEVKVSILTTIFEAIKEIASSILKLFKR